jgi:RimJ/RimL family protein N-acetyltransferase
LVVTHSTGDAHPKQLQMFWPEHLMDVAPDALAREQALPAGYELRTYRDGDEAGYLTVMHAAGFASFDHAGKKLGRVVCAAATARFLRAGYRRIYLKTDDWRLPAIVTYLRLGYVPLLYAPDMAERWQAVHARLNWPYAPGESSLSAG